MQGARSVHSPPAPYLAGCLAEGWMMATSLAVSAAACVVHGHEDPVGALHGSSRARVVQAELGCGSPLGVKVQLLPLSLELFLCFWLTQVSHSTSSSMSSGGLPSTPHSQLRLCASTALLHTFL